MASLSFHFKIELDDGTITEVDSIPFDIIRWERNNHKSFAEQTPGIESLLWIAWCAARRTKATDEKLFDDYAAKVIGFDTTSPDNDESVGTKDGQVDPTLTAV
jgi:hypothetical protein